MRKNYSGTSKAKVAVEVIKDFANQSKICIIKLDLENENNMSENVHVLPARI